METTVSNPNTQLSHNQRTTDKGTLATAHRFDGPWLEDVDTLTLGRGVQVKILFQDDNHTDMLVKFPPGYVEPEHTHQASHSASMSLADIAADKTGAAGQCDLPADDGHCLRWA